MLTSVHYFTFVIAAISHFALVLGHRRYEGVVPGVPPLRQKPPAAHDHHHSDTVSNILNADAIEEERAHIQEHMEIPIDTENLSEKQLQFHYFRIADADKNNKLDGQELVYFIIHRQNEGNSANKTDDSEKSEKGDEGIHSEHDYSKIRIFTDEELINAIDPIMDLNDRNQDGMIDWQEFVISIEEQERKSPANEE